jgi:hypothetical protein
MNIIWREFLKKREYDYLKRRSDRFQTIYYGIRRHWFDGWWFVKTFPKRYYQRLTRGFDYTEMWNLDHSIAKLVAPRLREFRDHYTEFKTPSFCFEKDPNNPSGLVDDEAGSEHAHKKWLTIIDQMLYSFEHLAKECDWDLSLEDMKVGEIKTGNPKYDAWCKSNNKHHKKMNEGFRLFSKHLGSLWD